MSVVNSALSKISEQKSATPKTIEKAKIPTVKRGVSPFVWVGIGVFVSLAIGGWAMTSNQTDGENVELVKALPKETQTVIVEVEPLIVEPLINESFSKENQTAPTQKTDPDTDIVTVYSHDDLAPKTTVTVVSAQPKVESAPVTKPVAVAQVAKSTKSTQAKPESPKVQASAPSKVTATEKKPLPVIAAKPETPAPQTVPKPILLAKSTPVVHTESMIIEQVELTPQELAKQAISRAKKAVESHDADTAISEYTRALRFVATDEDTRQRLAALYYGKRQPRKSMDLLQQGIQINPEGEPLRIALAKLLLKEEQTEAALSPLAYLPASASNDYLALRAGIAQQIKNVDIAKQSYSILAEREPQNGRWWLGLGIQQERSLDFELAMVSYQSALGKVGVSNSSQEFIRQRIALLESMQEDSNGN